MERLDVQVQKLSSYEDTQNAYCCMTEVLTPWPQSLCLCRDWISSNLGKHVEGYHLVTARGETIGHLYYAASQDALFPYQVEDNVCVLYCEWIQRRFHGYGFGKLLFSTLEDNLRSSRVKGILVEATEFENQMYYQHYLQRGFSIIYESGRRKLMYLPITKREIMAIQLPSSIKTVRSSPVEIILINGYLCPYEVSTQVILREIVKEFAGRVQLQEVWLSPDVLAKFGSSRGIFINGQQKLFGGESESEIRQAIMEEL